jgi:hypothetical protein
MRRLARGTTLKILWKNYVAKNWNFQFLSQSPAKNGQFKWHTSIYLHGGNNGSPSRRKFCRDCFKINYLVLFLWLIIV